MDQSLDQTLNIGTEIRLADKLLKHVKIGSVGVIRQVRQTMKGNEYLFSYSIGRDAWPADGERKAIDWPAVEAAYKKSFNMVLVEGLTDEELEIVDEEGIKELDTLLERFL